MKCGSVAAGTWIYSAALFCCAVLAVRCGASAHQTLDCTVASNQLELKGGVLPRGRGHVDAEEVIGGSISGVGRSGRGAGSGN